ncbi:hypothetical protein [Ectobacillus ponti]|uniref:Uncharacterized protein n=1 Tax=Ectobacillus ponti TaxID=2961894 RepID=A0AA41X800_9BACI|nr:hypothetical protein [Ectobacillus ponti]MCP8968359.1 hypothetical protein [Ectobacillus ponti]
MQNWKRSTSRNVPDILHTQAQFWRQKLPSRFEELDNAAISRPNPTKDSRGPAVYSRNLINRDG